MPALLIWGTDDPVFSQDYADALASNITLLPLEGAGHWPHFEQTDAVNAAIKNHIKGASEER